MGWEWEGAKDRGAGKRLGGAPGYETTARRPGEKKTFVNGVENGQGVYILKQYPCRFALERLVAVCLVGW